MANQIVSRVDLCGRYFVPLKRYYGNVVEYAVIAVKCGSWECPDCRKIKAEQYRRRIGKLFDGRKLWMLTLTYYHNIPAVQAWAQYNDAWNRLRTSLTKSCGKFSFARVLESHEKSPYPHLHVICDREFPPTVLNKLAIMAGFGYQMKFVPVTSARAAEYITKYLTKEWSNAESLAIVKKMRVRRVSFSRDIVCDEQSKIPWECIGLPTGRDAAVESITVDREFDTSRGFTEIGYVERPDFVLMQYHVKDLPPGFYTRNDDDDWQPDDWVPK